jgi:hypothetical protein
MSDTIGMPSRDPSLLSQIESDVVSDAPLAGALRKCIVLGGAAGSVELRDWATKELRGYSGEEDLPAYRSIPAGLYVDGLTGPGHVTGQRIGVHFLPDFAQEVIGEIVQVRDGIGEIEALIQQGDEKKGFVQLSLPGAMELAAILDQQSGNPWQHITALYWKVPTSALRGVVDQVRTTLAELVAEMRAGLPKDQSLPSADLATQAMQVAVHGAKARVTVQTVQGSPGGHLTVTDRSGDEAPWWTKSRKVGAVAVGLATVVAAVAAVLQVVG